MSSNIIKVLPDQIANKIAAGEVVQRPESVVKELMENSVDAGAKTIDLIIKKAGKSLIQVCDDGSGMTEEDAVLCVRKHATSKIATYEDLEAISTLGFRGEALSSISAVSQLEIKTERREDEVGTLIRFEDNSASGTGTIIKEKGSFAKGTIVSVKNLFFNTPARRNFLKSDVTELKHIIDTFNKIALSHPELAFRFYNDDDLIYDYSAGDLDKRISQVFADNMLDALIPVEERTDYLSVFGYVGKPTLLKKSKGEQYLFLNNRFVVSKQINHAVFTAYENILEKGDYPFFVLFLELDPHKTDVNVHPSKLEVKFDDEKDIYNFVLAVIRKSLGTHDLVPAMSFTDPLNNEEKLRFNSFNRVERNDFSDRPSFSERKSVAKTDFSDREIDMIFSAIPDNVSRVPKADPSAPHPFENVQQEEKPKAESREIFHTTQKYSDAPREEDLPFLIQLHNKYILSQIKSGLMIIDQHVAHERILYEKALGRMEANMPFSQQLLFPLTIEVDPARQLIIKEIYPMLVKLGFELKFFGKNTLVIEGVPDDIKPGSEEKVLMEVIDEFT